MNNINEQLKTINGILDRIDAKQKAINDKLDEVIKALHEYDDDQIQHCEYSGLPSVKAYEEKDIMAWDVDGAERRMDIIGQNGNEGLHYDAEDDYGTFRRVVEDKNKSNNTQTKHTGGDKKRNKRYYKPKTKQ